MAQGKSFFGGCSCSECLRTLEKFFAKDFPDAGDFEEFLSVISHILGEESLSFSKSCSCRSCEERYRELQEARYVRIRKNLYEVDLKIWR